MRPSLPLLCLALVSTAVAQSCSNYGSGTNCTNCPSGLGGSNCTTLLCGNALQPPQDRPSFSRSLAGAASLGCYLQCSSGWTGPTCSVPVTAAACAGATSGGESAVLSSGAWVWTEGHVSCDVVNPTLQGSFPGTTTLDFQHVADTSLSLYPSTAPNDTMTAQLWYTPNESTAIIEQFYCRADTCSQTNSTSTTAVSVTWACKNLKCTCIPGTAFCGGGNIDLADTINGLSGTISVTCDAAGASCAFKQSVLQTLFGADGLSLSGCQHGECVRPSDIATIASSFSTSSTGGGSSLSPGVIGGLAVLGGIVLFLLALLGLGFISQRKARRQPIKLVDPDEGKAAGAAGVRWEALGYALPARARSWIPGRPRRNGRIILDNLNGHVEGGQLCAILGPSGAGKSTLVDLLAGKRKSGEKSGSVHFALPSEWNESVKIGVVDQHDILPPTSTVREALLFAANLKMPENVSQAIKNQRVFEVLAQLGLQDVADSKIGGTERRGISGGERRRLSIGLELLAAPSVLICDEPTSGLDSTSALRVVQVLKSLTDPPHGRKTTVITTIHQPSSQIFYLFDHVILLGGGRQLYNGSPNNVAKQYAVPEGWNPADHLLDIASSPSVVAPRHASLTGSSADSDKDGDLLPTRPVLRKFSLVAEGPSSVKIQSTPVTTLLTQFEVLAARELRNLRRDWTLVVMHVTVSAIVGLFVGGLYYKVNLTIGGFQSRIGSLFFLAALLSFSSLSALSNFSNVKHLFLRERANSYYSPFSWFLSRVVLDIIPLRIFPTIIVSCIVYWMVGLAHSAAHFFKFLLILILFNIATTMWNLFLAAIINDSGIAILVSSVINLFQMAFAGFFVNLASIPPVLRWLQWLAPLKYTLEALAVNEVSAGLMIVDSLEGVKVQINAEVIMATLFGFKGDAYYRDVLVLFAFLMGFALALVVTVVVKLRELR
ncbi:hypothetical protein BCR35DRAFT_292865 [Leucosporidium creatinivorum]|uniref:ABC transporter domain-containing protein n=1 Tax=Leucosporidium creatinivorum TaxID=106004 RepID=A0A1Y2EVN2_9BASI|nr:hypothetical protein BCR35DRAFT_292865 [Leucosporidium creatinivorum]